VTHDVGEAFRLGDQIAVLSGGHLMQVGTPIELLTRPANDFVSQLVGSKSVVRQFEYLPVTVALEPQRGEHERISATATLLDALLRLIQTGDPALTVEEDGRALGEITLKGIAGGLGTQRQSDAAGDGIAAQTAMSAASQSR
jgi:osmoprotectant transport system ATP-binding protein